MSISFLCYSRLEKHLRARVSIQQGATLGDLLPVLASFAFERVMRITYRVLVEREQLSQGLEREMSLCILFLVYHCGGQSLLRSLSLEDLFFDGPGRNESVDEACVEVNHKVLESRRRLTYIPSSAHHATRGQEPVDQQLDSNLKGSFVRCLHVYDKGPHIPGSNRINRFAPIRLIPHPPAFELSKKMNSFPSGSLN